MRYLKTLAMALLLAGVVTTPALAKPRCADGACYRGGTVQHVERINEALSLTPEQETEISKVLADRRAKMTARREEARANRTAVRDLLAAPSLDEPRLRAALRKQSDLRADRLIARHATHARINQVLTAEQQAKWQEFRRQRMEGHERRGKPGT